jgi:hypothetical protein
MTFTIYPTPNAGECDCCDEEPVAIVLTAGLDDRDSRVALCKICAGLAADEMKDLLG